MAQKQNSVSNISFHSDLVFQIFLLAGLELIGVLEDFAVALVALLNPLLVPSVGRTDEIVARGMIGE